MSKSLDLVGKKFGNLTGVRNTGQKNNNGSYVWEWLCDCGNTHYASSGGIRYKNSGKCNTCKRIEVGNRSRKHGIPKNNKTYKAWCKIKERCYNKNCKEYPKYGAVGITMEPSWIDNFIEFMNYIGSPPDDGKKYSIDRVDNTKGYIIGNIQWATYYQQARNRGMLSSNTTGYTGVKLDEKSKGKFYYVAFWKCLSGRNMSKSFSINTYGEELAFLAACEYRDKQIMLLNFQGAGYSPRHGESSYNSLGGTII